MALPTGRAVRVKVKDVSTDWSLSVEQATEGWLLHLRARNLSPMTVKAYRAAAIGLARFLRSRGMPVDVEAITAEHIESYIESEVQAKAAATAHQRYRGLRQFFKWLRSQGDIAADPMTTIKPPIVPEHHIATVSDESFRAMLRTCDDSLEGLRDAALLRTLWDTGGRLSEVTGLKVADVNFTEQIVTLFGKGRRFRNVYIAPATGAAIHRYLRKRAKSRHGASERLWTGQKGPMTPSGVRQMTWRRSSAAGIPRVHPHKLRHSKADAWLSAGGSELGLRKQMGWRSPVMVARYAAANAERRSIEEARRLGLGDRL